MILGLVLGVLIEGLGIDFRVLSIFGGCDEDR